MLRAALLIAGTTFALTSVSGAGAAARSTCVRTALVADGPALRGCAPGGPWRTLTKRVCDLACSEWSLPRRTGTLAAYVQLDRWKCATASINVVDLRTGRRLAGVVGGSDSIDYTPNGCAAWGGTVTDLVLRGRGAVAFIDVRWDGSLEVVRYDRRGFGVLAHDATIERTSLTLGDDGRVAWRDGGGAHSAALGVGLPQRR
jgi:hypothetical protein